MRDSIAIGISLVNIRFLLSTSDNIGFLHYSFM